MRQELVPESLHPVPARRRWFEGWYHKMVGADGTMLVVIPGHFQGAGGAPRFGFVMVFDAQAPSVRMARYAADEVHGAADGYDLRIGNSRFTRDVIELDIDRDGVRLHGRVEHVAPIPWPVTLTSPGVMGWYGWMPLMQCWHGVVSLDHGLAGTLTLDGVPRRLDGGHGYIEKDWGTEFPSSWVWVQANRFAGPGSSLTASVATIPWHFGRRFAGFIVGLQLDGTLHRFTTYVGARVVALDVDEGAVRWSMRNRSHALHLRIRREGATVLLPAPTEHDMLPRVPETLGATVEIRLETLAGDTVLDTVASHAGLEVMGDLDDLRRLLGVHG